MIFNNKKRFGIGLDIGSGSIKAVELFKNHDGQIRLLSTRQLKLKAEGILDDEELSRSLSSWLHQSSWSEHDLCLGLPHYLSTVQIRDFPAAPEDKLKEMISYETIQLAGISEEQFIYDYHIMPPKFGRKNPVLIGISRQSVINEKLRVVQNAGIQPTDITMNSMAIINTLFALRPEIKNIDSPQMIIEIGAENSALIIFAAGQILLINSLLFGSEKYNSALAQAFNLDPAKTEEEKLKARLDIHDKNHPIYKTSLELLNEIKNALEQWRTHENSAFLDEDFVKIWLCGGGSAIKGLTEFFKLNFRQAQVETLGPQDETGKISPEMTVAYGLALQAVEASAIKISLTPQNIRWYARKKRNFSYLSLCLLLLVISASLFLAGLYINLKSTDNNNRKIILRLKKCEELIPQIENLNDEIRHCEKMILPFAAHGNNVPKIISALNELANGLDENIIIAYLADEQSFRALKNEQSNQSQSFKSSFFSAPSRPQQSSETATILKDVEEVSEIEALILYGFTVSAGKNEHFELVRALQTKLDKSNIFGTQGKTVDLLADEEKNSREIVTEKWFSYVVNNKDVHQSLGRKRLREFALRIPFEEQSIQIPKTKEEPNKAKTP